MMPESIFNFLCLKSSKLISSATAGRSGPRCPADFGMAIGIIVEVVVDVGVEVVFVVVVEDVVVVGIVCNASDAFACICILVHAFASVGGSSSRASQRFRAALRRLSVISS